MSTMVAAFRPCKVREMTTLQRAWVAGLLEGEGSFLVVSRSSHLMATGRVSIQMTDRDVLERLAEIVGTGRVSEVNRTNRPDRKPIYTWKLQARADVLALIDQVEPFMGYRRTAQIQLVRFVYATEPTLAEHRKVYPKIKPGWTRENGHVGSVEPDPILRRGAPLVGVDEQQPLAGSARGR